jgi:hypothetical protein
MFPDRFSAPAHGRITPSLDVAIRIAQALNVSLDYLAIDGVPRRPLHIEDNCLAEASDNSPNSTSPTAKASSTSSTPSSPASASASPPTTPAKDGELVKGSVTFDATPRTEKSATG